MNAQILETIYQSAAQTLASSRGDDYAQARASLVSRIPSDVQFAEAVAKQSLGVMYVAANALRRIEDAIAPGEKAIKAPSDVHLEHIMPKAHGESWKGKAGEEAYDDVVQRWGNLTLLLDKLNIQVGNGDWDTKRIRKRDANGNLKYPGYQASKASMTHDLVEVPDWSSAMIDLRSRWLGIVACRVWRVEDGPSASTLPSFSAVARNHNCLLI